MSDSSSSNFPKREQRQACYLARDQYWTCLDKFDGHDEAAADKACSQERTEFESACPPTWVTHFLRKYKYLKFKEKVASGSDPVDE